MLSSIFINFLFTLYSLLSMFRFFHSHSSCYFLFLFLLVLTSFCGSFLFYLPNILGQTNLYYELLSKFLFYCISVLPFISFRICWSIMNISFIVISSGFLMFSFRNDPIFHFSNLSSWGFEVTLFSRLFKPDMEYHTWQSY